MKLNLDEKQLNEIKHMINRVVVVAQRIATEMKRANDLKEKSLTRKRT